MNNVVYLQISENIDSGRSILALKNDGTLYGLGSILPPEGLENVIDIAAGWYNFLAVQEGGNVIMWGWSSEEIPSELLEYAIYP